MSVEPSMEEILSSIKRIIAEEGESPIRGRRVGRAAPAPASLPDRFEDDEAEVLELRDPIAPTPLPASTNHRDPEPARPAALDPAPELPPRAPAAAEPIAPAPVSSPMPDPVAEPDPAAEPILSTRAAAASRTSLDSLSKLMVRPEPSSDGTLEGMVREMLRPMLRDWLDANLPAMVETMVQAEIRRITATND